MNQPDGIQLRHYQTEGINQLAALGKIGTRRIVFQAATGSGKTVTFAALSDRVRKAMRKRIVIAVHREELLQQTVTALQKVAGITAGMLIADHKTIVQQTANGFIIPHMGATVVVCMVETLNNRLKRYSNLLGEVGMLIVDECHLGNFTKIYEHFTSSMIVGFSATPISANKRDPLKNHFDDIVCPISIAQLINEGFLAKNITISVKGGVDRKKLKKRGADFDEKLMALMYSKQKHLENCVKAYEKYALGQKTLVFNCNVEHSELVTEAFVRKGYNARHIDGNASYEHRKATLKWFAETHDAILNSVNILNTGFDEPTIESILVNRDTMSLTLWIQMAGRGGRRIPGVKDHFQIIDLGSNVATHMDWNYPHDWTNYFHNPEAAGKKGGAPPTKICINKECEAMLHLSTKICPYCFTNNEKPIVYDKEILDLEVLTKGWDIEKTIARNSKYLPYKALHLAKNQLIAIFRSHYKHNTLSEKNREGLNDRYQLIVREWCKREEKVYDKFHKETTKQWLFAELDRYYGILEPQSDTA